MGLFQQAPLGSSVRVGGRLANPVGASEERKLTTSDGGCLRVVAGPELALAGVAEGAFVEVVGAKAGDVELRAVGMMLLPGEVDVELWDEAVKLMHVPQLQEMFVPLRDQIQEA